MHYSDDETTESARAEPCQAGVRDGRAGDFIDPAQFTNHDYRAGLQEGRSARMDDELLAWDEREGEQ